MKKVIAIFCLSILFLPAKAQREAYNWFFPQAGGLTWNTTKNNVLATGLTNVTGTVSLNGIPSSINVNSNIMKDSYEGCFSLSDAQGRLMFFSDGVTVWNKNMVKMNTTDLTGNPSSAQSGIIIPRPGYSEMYMAITLDQWNNGKLSYSVINMAGNSGLGSVIAHNILFPTTGVIGSTGESVTAIRHANKTDYWVIAPSKVAGTATYMNVWKVTSGGTVAFVRRTENLGFGFTAGANGYIKFSPDGKYFAWATWTGSRLVWGEFNTSDGTFSNIKYSSELKTPSINSYYGIEFSPSGKYLYVTPGNNNQYDIKRFKFTDLLALNISNTDITSLAEVVIRKEQLPPQGISTLQMGPDRRMYAVAVRDLYVFENLDKEINDLKVYQISNHFPTTTDAKSGLPSFAASWFSAKIQGPTELCVGDPAQTYTVELESNNYQQVTLSRSEWDFGDGTGTSVVPIGTGETQISKDHQYTTASNYTITIRFYDNSNALVDYLTQTLDVTVNYCVLPLLRVNPQVRSNIW